MILRFPIEPIGRRSPTRGGRPRDSARPGRPTRGSRHDHAVDSRFLVEDAKFLETLPLGADRPHDRRGAPARHHDPDGADRPRRRSRRLQRRQRLHRDRGLPRQDVFTAYGPVDLDSLRWALLTKIDRSEAMAPLHALGRRILAGGWRCRCWRRCSRWPGLDHHPADRGTGAGGARGQPATSRRACRSTRMTSSGRWARPSTRWSRTWGPAGRARCPGADQRTPPPEPAAGVRCGAGPRRVRCAEVVCRRDGGLRPPQRLRLALPRLGEDQSMTLLSDIVAAFDEAAEQHGVEKVRTIGSSYLAASACRSIARTTPPGSSSSRAKPHASSVASTPSAGRADARGRHQHRTDRGRPRRPAKVHLRPLGRHRAAGA